MCKYTREEKTKNIDTWDGRIIHSHKLGFKINMSFSKWLCKFNGRPIKTTGRVSMLVCAKADNMIVNIYMEM